MGSKRILKTAIYFALSIFLITNATKSLAVTFDIMSPLVHDGLTFADPLIMDHPEQIKLTPIAIEFETQQPTITDSPVTPSSVSQVSDVLITEKLVTATPTPTVTPQPTVIPTSAQLQSTGSNTSTGGGLNADVLFSMSNNYRISHGLPAFQTDAKVCSLAQVRAPEIGPEIAEGRMHAGKNSHSFPYWFTENIISMNSESAAFNWWINDPIHHDAIVGVYSYSCVACSGNACVQEFTNFQPK